ncbi:hypothetical protein V6N12_041584 [Hibiscus sabdariffa]|uniref:Expansin-like EG45 domain-containing protein n=1 Tax=Hibiscus sabdariffa TaxID=183260 RepID=A0ABR2ARD0_9ROSI
MAKLGIILFVAIVFVLGFSFREVVAHSGTATFYTAPYVPSACYGYEDDGVMIAAASDAIWDGGAVCGRQYKVKCKGATNESPHPCRGQDYVVVKIVDYCPSGCQGTIDLSQEAFAAIADPDAGKIKIYFHQNDKIFRKKASTSENCLFHAKLKALTWLKTSKGKDFDELNGWWSSPRTAIAVNQISCWYFGADFKFTVAVHMESNRMGIGGTELIDPGCSESGGNAFRDLNVRQEGLVDSIEFSLIGALNCFAVDAFQIS